MWRHSILLRAIVFLVPVIVFFLFLITIPYLTFVVGAAIVLGGVMAEALNYMLGPIASYVLFCRWGKVGKMTVIGAIDLWSKNRSKNDNLK